ncbi:hypothetical protein EPN28_02355 [Patescibacteria group bacterium]|nr:MAG: hypothetical protein EPN28_02355 [Patescibacteria group bacterium]
MGKHARKLTEKELHDLAVLREEGFFLDVEPKLLDVSGGAIVVLCGDGDQALDQMKYIERVCRPRPHLHAINGGPLLMNRKCPDPAGREKGNMLFEEIRESRELKEIDTVVLIAHVPCGKADAWGLDVITIVDWIVGVKDEIKDEINHGLRVRCKLHVDWTGAEEDKRTYFLSGKKWREFRRMQLVRPQ